MSSPKSARHYATDWIFRNSKVTGLVRWVFVGIAQKMRGTACETPPMAVEAICELTGMGESTIRRSIKEIEQEGDLVVIKSRRRGEMHKYVLGRNLRLPMDVDPPQRSERAASVFTRSGESPPIASGVSVHSEQSAPQRSVRPVSASGVLVQQAYNSDLSTQYNDLSTSSSTEYEEAEALRQWIRSEYPKHNGGASFTLDAAMALDVLIAMLVDRPADRLQAIFVTAWTITRPEEPWFFTTDRSLFAIQHKADQLEKCALARARQRPQLASTWTCLSCEKQNPAALKVCLCGEGRPVQREVSA